MSCPEQHRNLRWLARTCGRIRGAAAVALLVGFAGYPNAQVRTEVLRALRTAGFGAGEGDVEAIEERITAELVGAAGYLQARRDLWGRAELLLLIGALDEALDGARERLFLLLSFLYDPRSIMGARDALHFGSERHRAYALELLETLLPSGRRDALLPVLAGMDPGRAVRHLEGMAPDEHLDPGLRLRRLTSPACAQEDPWLSMCARWCAGLPALQTEGGEAMPSMLERVMLLKTVSIFAGTPDHVLADVASVVEEEEYPAGAAIIRKGELGDSMFAVVSGRVRVHDGDTHLTELGEGEEFGEMTVLHPEPRSASVTAIEDTRVLRLRHDAFYDVAADRVEIMQAIVSTIANDLRARTADIARLTARVHELERALPDR